MFNCAVMGETGQSAVHLPHSAEFFGVHSSWLERTPAGDGNKQKATLHFAIRFDQNGTDEYFIAQGPSGNDMWSMIRNSAGQLTVYSAVANVEMWAYTTSATNWTKDVWHWITLIIDTTVAVEADRVRLYRDMTRVTSFAVAHHPLLNDESRLCSLYRFQLGNNIQNNRPFDGKVAGRFILADGYAPADLSAFYNTNGSHKAKIVGVSFGTNGFHLDFENAADLGNDISGSNHDLIKLGTVSQSSSSPLP